MDWALAFTVTCLVELAVVAVLAPARPGRLRIVLLAQVATHPLVWLAMAVLPGSQLVRLSGVELGATLVEAAIYVRAFALPHSDALGLSAAANAASLLVCAALAGAL